MNKTILMLCCIIIIFAVSPAIIAMVQPTVQISDIYGNDTSYTNSYVRCVSAMAEVKSSCHQIVKTDKDSCLQNASNSEDKKNSEKSCMTEYKIEKRQCRIVFRAEKKECAKIKHSIFDSIKVMFK
jgi:hypothetical protein